MQKNMSNADRIIRIIVGIVIIWLGFTYRSMWSLLGIIPIATGLSGWCALYQIIGKGTLKK